MIRYCLVVLWLVIGVACHRVAPPPARPGEVRTAAVPVKLAMVTTMARTQYDEVVGTVRPTVTARVSAKLGGVVLEAPLVVGQVVKPGDFVAQLEAREIRAQVDQAKAVVEQANADLARIAKLLEQQVSTPRDHEAAQMRAKVAQAQLEEAQVMVGYLRLAAPFGGVVVAKLAEAGDLATPGRPLIELAELGAMRLEAFVPEVTAGTLRPGQVCEIELAALARTLTGSVAEIAPMADPASRTFLVKFALPADPGLRAGHYGRVRIPVAETQSVLAPAAAIVAYGQMETVFTVDGERARLRLVRSGKRLGDQREILAGLSAGEQVIVPPPPRLVDGQRVQVTQ
jgi:RND family efflux transporter MFP subunit